MITHKQQEFMDNLSDSKYRAVFADELVGTSLAFQIRRLRDARGLSQTELANQVGNKQPTISLWEDPNYGRYTLSKLKELAAAFDVGLLVRFVSFGELAEWTVDVRPERQTPPTYDQERQLSFGDTQGGHMGEVWTGPVAYPHLGAGSITRQEVRLADSFFPGTPSASSTGFEFPIVAMQAAALFDNLGWDTHGAEREGHRQRPTVPGELENADAIA